MSAVNAQAKPSPDAYDALIARMENLLRQVDASQGSVVKLSKVELDFLAEVEAARNFMEGALHIQDNRYLLEHIFGGDCIRISRTRAVLEAAKLSDGNAQDQRLPTCISSCESVEKVLQDLGLGFCLRQSLEQQRYRLQHRGSEEIGLPGIEGELNTTVIDLLGERASLMQRIIEEPKSPSTAEKAEPVKGSPVSSVVDVLVESAFSAVATILVPAADEEPNDGQDEPTDLESIVVLPNLSVIGPPESPKDQPQPETPKLPSRSEFTRKLIEVPVEVVAPRKELPVDLHAIPSPGPQELLAPPSPRPVELLAPPPPTQTKVAVFPRTRSPAPDMRVSRSVSPRPSLLTPVPHAGSARLPTLLPRRSGRQVHSCPQGHALQQFVNQSGFANACNYCGSKISPPLMLFRCAGCDFDCCQQCVSKAPKRMEAPSQSASGCVEAPVVVQRIASH